MKKRAKPKRKPRKQSEREQVIARAEHLRTLLAEFGLSVRGFDPGVTAYRAGSGSVAWDGSNFSFDHAEWNWLEPLLVELRGYRMANRVFL